MQDEAPPGVPEWVVTYGDMMSLLLTFFIMLVSLSEVVAENKYRAIIEAARQYMGYSGSPVAPPGKSFPLNSVLESLREMKLGSVSDDEKGTGGVKRQSVAGEELRVTRLKEGESYRVGEPILFPSGSGELLPASRRAVDEVAREVAGKPHKLEIRAYSSPFVNGMPQSPRERMQLSYSRAEKVLNDLLEHRVERNRLRIAVFFHDPQIPLGKSGTLPPDRLEITIYDEFAETFVGRDEDYR